MCLPDIGGMLGLGFKQANTTREQEYARYRSNVQTGTCNFRYKLRTVEAVFLPDIGGMLGLGFNQAKTTREQENAILYLPYHWGASICQISVQIFSWYLIY